MLKYIKMFKAYKYIYYISFQLNNNIFELGYHILSTFTFIPDKNFALKLLLNCTQGHDTSRAYLVRETVQNVENTSAKNVSRWNMLARTIAFFMVAIFGQMSSKTCPQFFYSAK